MVDNLAGLKEGGCGYFNLTSKKKIYIYMTEEQEEEKCRFSALRIEEEKSNKKRTVQCPMSRLLPG